MGEANFSVKYQGTLTTILINTPFTKVYRYKIVNYGNLQRREELLTDGVNKEVNFDDGKFLWRFFPNKNLVIKGKSCIISPLHFRRQNNLELVKQNYGIQVVGKYDIDGRDGYKILFNPKKTDRPQQIFWIDAKTGIPFKIEKYGPNDRLVSVSSFSNINFQVPTHKNLYLKVPPQTNIREIKEKCNLSILKAKSLMGNRIFSPQYLPAGFKLKNIVLRIHGKQKNLQLFYTDGLSALSVFQKQFTVKDHEDWSQFIKIKLGKSDAFFTTSGALNTLNIRSRPISTTLMGEIFQEEIIKVAESLNPVELNTPLGGIKKNKKKQSFISP
ncbi:MAG: DUF4367 domain-containing protein [Deltaproteobacteria bacterium]|nr:DUF4367 domain-containing protein [Deltaproteobacteria bacterium]